MKLLKEKIMSEGLVLNDAILKVDSFLITRSTLN